MKTMLGLSLSLAIASGCTTVPDSTKSSFLSTYTAGFRYKNGDPIYGVPFLWLDPQPSAPDIMYVEVTFPDPSQPNGHEVLRKEIKKAEGSAKFEGTRRSGWKTGTIYEFVAKVYSDPSYTTLL